MLTEMLANDLRDWGNVECLPVVHFNRKFYRLPVSSMIYIFHRFLELCSVLHLESDMTIKREKILARAKATSFPCYHHFSILFVCFHFFL